MTAISLAANPIDTYDVLTPAALTPLGFDDPAQACRILQGMAGHDVPDDAFGRLLGTITQALVGSADPDRAITNLGRWTDAAGSRTAAYRMLAADPEAVRSLLLVFAASQFFADLLIKTPEYLEVVTNPAIRDRARGADALASDLERRVGIAKTPNARRDALRRFKPPEVLRIGVRDLLGLADMAETARAISDFADESVRMAFRICADELGIPDAPLAVLALGKLGGRELNYASDIDLVFVHDDAMPQVQATRLGEAIRDALARATDAGFVFRVDLRLRPEGRFGPVSRSLGACRAYYESWAEPWERQALMKARFVAGNTGVGAAFARMAEEFVYPARVDEAFVATIQGGKRRLEEKIARAGEADVNVKEGVGGIRDVEFAVQLLQLVAGGTNPDVRGGNTLAALEALAHAGLLSGEERETLADSYCFLRTVEHRLQIRDELPVRCLPRDTGELRRFGRRLGYADGLAFLADYRRHTARVHALFVRLFYGDAGEDARGETSSPLAEWVLAPDDPAAQSSLSEALAARGFRDIAAAQDLLRRSVAGSRYGDVTPDARAAFAALVPALLDAAGGTPDPDAALRGLDALADAVPSRAALDRSLSESVSLLPRLCLLAASSPYLWQMLLGHLELLDLVADDEAMDQPPTLRPAATLAETAAQARRARLQTGARDLWGLADTVQVVSEVTGAAAITLGSALDLARRELGFVGRFAVVGLGKLGGDEMGYGSDLDVLYVADTGALAPAARLAERAQRILKDDLAPFGFRCEMDARLRPEGRKGQLVLDVASYQRYWAESAQTWERQALVKARWVAGDEELGREFIDAAHAFVYGLPLGDEHAAEIQAMKRRLETERSKGAGDLKLGPGGLTDIEWTAQMLQMRHGARRARLRTPNTLEALRRLRDDALLTQADWEALSTAYEALTRSRNRLYLRAGVSPTALMSPPDALRAQMAAARAACLRLFYAE